MKPTVLFILLAIFIFSGIVIWKSVTIIPDAVVSGVLPTPTAQPSPELLTHAVSFADRKYVYAYIRTKPADVTLIPNYAKQLEFTDILRSASCTYGVNGGFYDESNNPIGLFTADNLTAHGEIESSLFNGYFAIFGDGTAEISDSVPENPKLALQSGPLLIKNSVELPLRIRNDEFARRMVAALSPDGNPLFIAVYDPESVFEGPKLADLPTVISIIAEKEHIPVVSAINLDGGTASAIRSPDATVSELKPVGSVFCVRM